MITMITHEFTKRLCMSELSIKLSTIPCHQFFSLNKNEKLSAAFVYIEKGYVELNAASTTLSLCSGSLVFIPENTFYTLKWTMNEEIRFYTITAIAKDYNTAMMSDNFSLQQIEELSNEKTGMLIARIYAYMSTDDRIKKTEAIGLYYGFYADALKYLTTSESSELHPALMKALNYIEQNYAENDTLAEIAKQCFISETRLFHLFQKQLNTTPVSYRNARRIQAATELLKNDLSAGEIATITGFNSVPYFYETFKKYTGITPKEYRDIINAK